MLYNADNFVGQIRHGSGKCLVAGIFKVSITSLKTKKPFTLVLLKL